MNPMMGQARPRPHRMCRLMVEKLLGNKLQKYSIQARKTVRGVVLDSPSKGKMTETCVAEGAMSVCPACFKDRLSHWSFDPLLDITK